MTSLFQELKRRNVFRVVITYIVLAWLILQVGETLGPALLLPGWVNSVLAFFLILGFPLAIFFAWVYEMTPEGIRKEKDIDRTESITPLTGRKLDRTIIVLLVVALGYFIWASRHPEQPAVTESGTSMTSGLADMVDAVASQGASIAVLPFVNMSSDVEQEYFADGLSEELLNLLAKIPELRVTSRSSAFSYKGKNVRISDVGRELNVAHVLEGSVRRSGDIIRITAQLIEVDTDTHLWSETWDRSFSDVFAIQDEIADAAVSQMKVELLGETPHSTPTSPKAYAFFLQARQNLNQRTERGYMSAERLLREALEIDPNYTPAWAALGRTIAYASALGVRIPTEAAPLAREALSKALELDAGDAVALATLANLEATYDYDYDAARSYIERGLEANPGNPELLSEAANLAFIVGDFDTSARLYREATELDPLNVALLNFLGYAEFFVGNPDGALAAFNRSVTLSPGANGPNYYVAMVHLAQGEHDRAFTALEAENMVGFRHTGEALIYHSLGNTESSDAALAALNELPIDWAYQRAVIHGYRGEADEAIEWLNTAVDIRDRGLNQVVGDPMLDNIRSDPRFKVLLERLNRTPVR